ncbi:GMC family oxidoreductase N-terminal domain-containing protein [Streptomyces sp. Ac-502]|uniref:GMC family oxidoreductase N-terminal domain-containing protein n=1 Tax=Streptomyces sp. Ac-502 TaxID=3342801 RepID=UPI0038626424
MTRRRAPSRTRTIACDALVIGSGAGGAVAALELARAGHRTVVLEEGPRTSTAEIAASAPAENLRRLYRDAGLTPVFGSPVIPYGEGRCVGGSTVVNGGVLWAPPDALLERWARVMGTTDYRADRLAEHVRTVSERLGVGEQQHGDGNADSRLLAGAADALGWHWAAARRAAPGCRHRNRCPTGCPSGAKRSMLVSYLPEAERYGARIEPDTRAVLLRHDGRTVYGVTAISGPDGPGGPGGPGGSNGSNGSGGPDGSGGRTRIEYRPRTVFLAAGAVGSALLLQRSGIHRRHAGRAMGFHVNFRLVARLADPVHATRGTIFTAQIREFDELGIHLMPANLTAGSLAAALAGHGPAVIDALLADLGSVLVCTVQVRMSGRVAVRQLGADTRLLRHHLTPYDHGLLRFALGRAARLLFRAGAVELYPPCPGVLRSDRTAQEFAARSDPRGWNLVSVHAMGSCPMGRPALGGVCDQDGRPYGFTNLRLCDASVLPGPAGISPQGTVLAFAHEIVARHLSAPPPLPLRRHGDSDTTP